VFQHPCLLVFKSQIQASIDTMKGYKVGSDETSDGHRPPLQVGAFREALATWFAEHGKDYPWRRTGDPYAILVSEVMLQQTQIATVLGRGYYERFLAEFPDVKALAAAEDERLLKAWEGLGYYRRARMLRETAREVLARHGGRFPQDWESLLDLPGIGRYTAGAVRAFAFNLPGAVVDGNVARVLARVLDFRDPVDDTAGRKQLDGWAEMLEDPAAPRIHNSALMELGQTHCRPGVPDCGNCPVARFCGAEIPSGLPVKRQRAAVTEVDEHALWVRDGDGRVLLHREHGRRRTGLWKLPVREAAMVAHLPVVAELIYPITRYRVRLRVHLMADQGLRPGPDEAWVSPDELARLPLAAPFRRAVVRLLAEP